MRRGSIQQYPNPNVADEDVIESFRRGAEAILKLKQIGGGVALFESTTFHLLPDGMTAEYNLSAIVPLTHAMFNGDNWVPYLRINQARPFLTITYKNAIQRPV